MGALLIHWGGPSRLPLARLADAIPMLSRRELEDLTERLIERLDELDGDLDLEEDDPAGQCDEDGVNTHGDLFRPACTEIGTALDYEDWGVGAGYGIDQTMPLFDPRNPQLVPVVDLMPTS